MFKRGEKMIVYLLFFVFLIHTNEAKGGMGKPSPPLPKKKWMTLNGGEPQIVANGGFSGLFPASSLISYTFASAQSLPGSIMLCDLQFTRDGEAFCESEFSLQNSTNVDEIDPKGQKTYNINGHEIHGWFGIDYDAEYFFNNVTLNQNIYTRPPWWDGQPPIMPQEIANSKNPPRIWLNVQSDSFYNQHRISPEDYILSTMMDIRPEFISSPEIGFLKSIAPKVKEAKTKLIFKFLGADVVEPTTKETYGSLLTKLPTIKSFAYGILVPKDFIWPTNRRYLVATPTNLVPDAHKQGLEVFTGVFANDDYLSYNYSYDATREYLQFVGNSKFSVDGVITDFPVTASISIGCLYQDKNASRTIKTLIISHDGASGDFPGATDLAYQKAIDDGVDIIDCSVQFSKDGVAFCLTSPDLTDATTATSLFIDRATTIPEIQPDQAIFTFDLTWTEIQSLKPQIQNAFQDLLRNPAYKNSGKFVTLPEFLELAKTKGVTGILINIQNAAYLASVRGLDIIGTVSTALSNASFDKQSTQKVLIQSDDSQVLLKFKDIATYHRVLEIKKDVSGTPDELAKEVKKYADAVNVVRRSIITATDTYFTKNFTNIIPAMHAANVSVYVSGLKNEFENLLLDYYSDPYVEIATLVDAGADGLITDFPITASSYARSPCHNKAASYQITGVLPGDMLAGVQSNDQSQTPAAPAPDGNGPLLSIADIIDPPLPPVAKNSTTDSASNTTSSSSSPSTAPAPKSSSSSATATKAGLHIAVIIGVLGFLSLE